MKHYPLHKDFSKYAFMYPPINRATLPFVRFAADVTLMARNRLSIPLCGQMLIYPVIDRRMKTESMQKFTDTPNAYIETAEFDCVFRQKTDTDIPVKMLVGDISPNP